MPLAGKIGKLPLPNDACGEPRGRDNHGEETALTARATTFIAAAALAIGLGALPALAAGDLMKGRQPLDEIKLGDGQQNDFAVTNTEITLETGKGYRLPITSSGGKEYKFVATSFFRHIWVDQIVVNDLEIHMNGGPAFLEFDSEGTIEIHFTPIKTGTYEWYIEGLVEKGMKGKFIVK